MLCVWRVDLRSILCRHMKDTSLARSVQSQHPNCYLSDLQAPARQHKEKADACMEQGKFDEALGLYEKCAEMQKVRGDEGSHLKGSPSRVAGMASKSRGSMACN